MTLKQQLLSRIFDAWKGVALLFALAYLVFHAFHGEYSLPALERLQQKEAELLAEANKFHLERQKLEKKVSLLDQSSMDPDMLEEQVRKSLGFAHPDEVVIFLGKR